MNAPIMNDEAYRAFLKTVLITLAFVAALNLADTLTPCLAWAADSTGLDSIWDTVKAAIQGWLGKTLIAAFLIGGVAALVSGKYAMAGGAVIAAIITGMLPKVIDGLMQSGS